MRKLLIMSFLLISVHVFSQEWNPKTAYWIYGASFMTSHGDLRVSYLKDTLVNDRECQLLKKDMLEYGYIDKTYSYRVLGNEVTYFQDGVTYILNNNQFDTLYYFSGKINDHYKITSRLAWNESNSSFAVIADTGSVKINNAKLKWQAVDYEFNLGDNIWILRDTIIESIGSTKYYFLPWDFVNGMVDGNEGGGLKCFHDSVLGVYSGKYTTDCKFDLSLLSRDTYEPFIRDSKIWRHYTDAYLLGESGTNGFLVFNSYFNGDSIIEGTKYRKLYYKMEQPVSDAGQFAYLIREDTVNQKVYIYDSYNHKDTILYDFKLKESDRFNIYVASGLYLKSTVLKVDTIESFGKKLKRIEFDDSIIWVEGIGNITRVPIPFLGNLICVTDEDYLLYLDSKFNRCDTIFPQEPWGGIQPFKSSDVKLFPNPVAVSSVLKVESKNNEPLMIEIYNYSGSLIKQDLFRNDYPIGLLNLIRGLYVYRLTSNNQTVAMGKFLVVYPGF